MPADRQVGDWIAGRFEVFEVHRGGMGVVYVAHDHLAAGGPKVVALKTLREEWLADRVRAARFATEGRLWARLGRHPNIVRALAVEPLEGRPHVVLELVTGGDLGRWIGTPRLDPPRALRFGLQFCLGMEHAIRAGLQCHRDVKPANLLIAEDGTLKITDFGVARLRDEVIAAGPDPADGPIPLAEPAAPQPIVWSDPRDQIAPAKPAVGASAPVAAGPVPVSPAPRAGRPSDADPGLTTTADYSTQPGGPADPGSQGLTRTGLLLGTVAYMAPEQFRDAKAVDVRADIYSFGVVLFEMLAGHRPFLGDTLAKLRRQHATAEPPSFAAAIPRRFAREAPAFDALVRRCLQKEPADRFATIAELRRGLAHILARIEPGADRRRPGT
jgi:serine/threonine protein kinase